MKRVLIMTVLCVLLLASIGALTGTAKQAGKSPVYHFDVTTIDKQGSGTLMINLDEHTFVLNGKGFDPGKTYYLRYTEAGAGIRQFASAVATKGGTIHAEGVWVQDLAGLPTAPTFTLSTKAAAVDAKLRVNYGSPQPCTYNGVRYSSCKCYYVDAVPSLVQGATLFALSEIQYPGNGVPILLYSGSDPYLGSGGTNNLGRAILLPPGDSTVWLRLVFSAFTQTSGDQCAATVTQNGFDYGTCA